MSKHIVASSSLGTDDPFLDLGFFCQSISSRIGDHRGRFIFKRLGSLLVFGVEGDASSAFCPSVKTFDRSNVVSSTSVSRSMFPVANENSMDGKAFCLVTAQTETKFSMRIRSLVLCSIWEFLLRNRWHRSGEVSLGSVEELIGTSDLTAEANDNASLDQSASGRACAQKSRENGQAERRRLSLPKPLLVRCPHGCLQHGRRDGDFPRLVAGVSALR